MKKMKLFFAGDVLIRKGVSGELFLSEGLKKRFFECDHRSCNLEGPVIDSNCKKMKKAGPSISQGSGAIKYIKDSGFDLLNLANNHIMDFGKRGGELTKKEAAEMSLDTVGLRSDRSGSPYLVKDINGIRTAFFSVSENGFGCLESAEEYGYDYFMGEKLFSAIKKAAESCDFVVVNVHAGSELFTLPLPEQRSLYREYIDSGADIVIGHHPHVIQGVETYKGKKIYYSLGNFRMDEVDGEAWTGPEYLGLSVLVSVSVDEGGNACYTSENVFVKNDNGGLLEYEDQGFEEKCRLLKEESLKEYEKLIDDYCRREYRDLYKPLYYRGNVAGLWDRGFINKLKMTAKLWMNRINFDDVFLLHNIEIETHRWITQRAVKLYCELYGGSWGEEQQIL